MPVKGTRTPARIGGLLLAYCGKSMTGLVFFEKLLLAMGMLVTRKLADKQANVAMDGLARKFGCNPFICRQY